jgi:hypothetical protein
LRRGDVLWRVLGQAAVLHALDPSVRVLVLCTDLPGRSTPAGQALRASTGTSLTEVVQLPVDGTALERLRAHAAGRRVPAAG